MSLFPRFTQEFSSPLFKVMMDDYERAMRTACNGTTASSTFRSFAPKFDVKELRGSYELHGELPGLDQKNVNIEWTDGNTLTISGRTENYRQEEDLPSTASDIEDILPDVANSSSKYRKPTIEEETSEHTSNVTPSELGAVIDNQISKKAAEDEPKFWVSERSVGEFHRSFSFPTRVDQDQVRASLKNGILSIVVPKAKAPQPRKINIE